METKQITLRSQTVRCSHCGEYYSVTYKYCPFCDAAREAEERKQAEKKNRKKALLGGLFGAPEPAPKKKKASSAAHSSQPHQKREPVRRESRPMDPVQAEPERSQSITEPLPRTTVQKDPAKKTPVKKDAPKKKESLFHKDHGHRRKTSELSEEEKAARLAEREARAAERKRERDRAAREAAVAAAPKIEAGPVFEEVTVPETFGFTEEPTVETDPAAFAQAPVSAEGPVVVPEETTPDGMEEIPVFAAPEATEEEPAEAAPETIAPVADTPPEDESERSRWEFLRGLEIMPDAPVVEVAVEGQPAAEPAEAQPVSVQPEVQAVPAEPVQTAQPVQETAVPEAPVQPAPVQSAPQETAVETEEDLDALLSEIRGMLADSPVPQLSPDQLKKPVQPAPPSVVDPTPAAEPEQLGTQTAEETPAPAAEEAAPAETIPAVDEPTRIMPAVTDAADAVSQPADESQDKPAAESCETLAEPETPAPAVPDEGMPLETSMDQEEEPDILAVKPAREKKAKEKAPRKRPEKKPAPRQTKNPPKSRRSAARPPR